MLPTQKAPAMGIVTYKAVFTAVPVPDVVHVAGLHVISGMVTAVPTPFRGGVIPTIFNSGHVTLRVFCPAV